MKVAMKTAVLIAAAVSAALLSGCGRKSTRKAPAFERMELVSRFFDSVRHERFSEAANQGRKLYDMDRNNEFLLHLITIHESNDFLRKAQEELNSGNVDAALRVLDQGSRKYPENRTLRMYRTKVSQLRNAKSLIAAMNSAKGEAAMSAALTAAETGLGTNMSPKLAAYFKNYETKIKKAAVASEKAKKRIEAEKEKRRIEADKARKAIPSGANAKSSRSPSASPKRQEVSKLETPESLDRPPPIAVPEPENLQ
jgi:hypothetical protein